MEQDEQRNVRILVVDDEPTITEFLEPACSTRASPSPSVADGIAALWPRAHFGPTW